MTHEIRQFPGYEKRPEQEAAANAVREAIHKRLPCLMEAGTGTGKTLAYLSPAVEEIISQGGTVVVSTHTIGLQEQLWTKDIPMIQSLYPEVDIRPAILKGKSNYLCRMEMDAKSSNILAMEDTHLDRVLKWTAQTETGDVQELNPIYPKWGEIAVPKHGCLGRECSHYNSCFYFKALKKAREASLLIVNHALYFANLKMHGDGEDGIIPEHDLVIFDEAHHLEDSVTTAFETQFRSDEISNMLSRLAAWRSQVIDPNVLDQLEMQSRALFAPFLHMQSSEFFLDEALDTAEKDSLMGIYTQNTLELLDVLTNQLREAVEKVGKNGSALGRTADACEDMSERLQEIMFGSAEGHIRHGSLEVGGKENVASIKYTPVDVSDILRQNLWNRDTLSVLSSATISTHGGFTYIKERLGLGQAVEVVIGSPFDFQNIACLYLPAHLQEPPKGEDYGYTASVCREVERLCRLSGGGVFVLCTSKRMVTTLYDHLSTRLPYPVLRQGDASTSDLIQRFREHGHSVLVGTSTFWEGVDIAGEALRCVIVDRLPFSVPDSPLHKARVERIKANGGDWFFGYALPQAGIKLKQAFGRLIRRKDDRGLVTILDKRLTSKQYGKHLLNTLPPAARVYRFDQAEQFWQNIYN